jgi:nickel-dependent lactate racemase
VKYNVQYGRGYLTLDIPQTRVAGVLTPQEVKPLADVGGAVRESLERPYASEPLKALLRGKENALVVTVDNTRPSPRPMILPVLDLCTTLGVPVTVIVATGRHRQMSEPELHAHLGQRVMQSCRVLQHDPYDEGQMVERGVTLRGTSIRVNRVLYEHDLVIGCGIIEPSYLCGWSGGRKLLMPGLAHYKSIDNNHYYLTQPGAEMGRLHGNPVSDDAFEFARDLPLHFIVYAVCGPNDEYVEIVSGHPVQAHERACALCEPIFRVSGQRADIVISSPGGWPHDFDLVQGKKAVIPAAKAVKPGGAIILCAECADGLGAEPTFIEWLREKGPGQVVHDVLDRRQFNLGAHGANILARPMVERDAQVILVTCPAVVRELEGTFLTAVTHLEEAWQMAQRRAGPEASVLLIEGARRLIVD